MGKKSLKRDRDVPTGDAADVAPSKRRRHISGDDIKISKLYEDLAAESDEVRLEAAKQLILKFSPQNQPSSEAVGHALNRLIRGLCSQRKAARIGFCVTLTELLREVLVQNRGSISGLNLDVNEVLSLVEAKTKIEGNVPGQERRDHLIGRLFGYKAVVESSILFEPELSLECWKTVLDRIYGMARDIPWLREECGMILCEAIQHLQSKSAPEECIQGLIEHLASFQLSNTPEGVAIWLTVRAVFPEAVLPEQTWHKKDPLHKKERSRLAKVLKEDFGSTSDGKDGPAIKSAAANPNPIFAWDVVLEEILQRDQRQRSKNDDSSKLQFAQFWVETVDGNLMSSSASHEKKSWGFKLLAKMATSAPQWALPALFSPNLMRSLLNQSKKEDRFLHAAAQASLKAIQARVLREPSAAAPIFTALTSKNGNLELDRITKTKTLGDIVLSTDDETLTKVVRHLGSLILRPDSQDETIAETRRRNIADMLLSIVRGYKDYDNIGTKVEEEGSWLRSLLIIMIDNAYFIPAPSAKTSKIPLPSIRESTRKIFQERLTSCLSRLLGIDSAAGPSYSLAVLRMICSRAATSKTLVPVLQVDGSITETINKAFETLDTITSKASGKTAEGFVLLYSLALLQVYEGDGDAVLMLDDLDASYGALSKIKTKNTTQGHDAFVEILLSFLGNPRALFRRIAQQAFTILASDLTHEGLQSLTDILDTEESIAGQRLLFAHGDEEVEEASGDDSEEDSDVEMVEGEADNSENDNDSDGSESEPQRDQDSDVDDEDSGDDEELTAFNNLLAQALQTKPTLNGEGEEESSDDEDMDDEQMMALDPHLSKIFKERSKISKKKQREEAKQTVVQFKSRVLDLLSIYMEKQYSNPLTFLVLLPVLRRLRPGGNKQMADKSWKLLKGYFETRAHHKAALPRPAGDEIDGAWEILRGIHEEMKEGGSNLHTMACSKASLHIVKALVALDRDNCAEVANIYSETWKECFGDPSSAVQGIVFTDFQNWWATSKKQEK
ncbi:DNA polymerase phi-domain-containing protein [Clohesyomyces aquaticus]|uniref:DNA polymerase phi-domain-containing protein n=1 Tax=Clohesyomyces aquaticus TaxID=1231657 RepID=A0A1Y1ZP85_9PLEO|nr:DNA polymerase phi-domain-containing protein [Clohesyomyces aquaticus]